MAESSGNPLGSLLVRFAADSSPFDDAVKSMIGGVDEAVGKINSFASRLSSIGLGMQAALPVTAVVTAAGAIGAAAVAVGKEYEEAFNTIIAKTGQTGTALTGLKENFETVFRSVPGDAQAIAGSISLISDRLHIAGDDVTNLATRFAQLSSFSGGDLVSLTDAVTKAFQNWNIATDDQGAALDLLNAISQKTGTDVTQLAGSMASIGNLARLSGVSFEQTAVQVGTLNAKGIEAQDVFMGISKAMATAHKSGVDLGQVTLPNLVFSIEQGIKSGNGLTVALEEFGAKAGPKMYELVKDGIISSAGLMATSLDKATDSIKKTYDATDTLGRQFTLLGKTIAAVNLPMGEFLLGAGKDFLEWLNKAVMVTAALWSIMSANMLKPFSDSANAAKGSAADLANTLPVTTRSIGQMKETVQGLSAPLVDIAAKMKATKEAAAEAAAEWKAVQAAAVGFQDATSPLAAHVSDVTEAIQKQQLSAYRKDVEDTAKSLIDLSIATGQSLNFKNAQEFFDAEQAAFQREHDAIQNSILDNGGLTAQLNALGSALAPLSGIVDNHTAVLQRLGIVSTAALRAYADAVAEDVQRLFELQAAGQATEQEVQAGVATMIAANAALGHSQDSTELKWQNNTKAVSELQQTAKRTFNDLSNGLAQAIVQGKSLGDVFKKVAQDISAAIINVAIKQGVKLLIDSLGGVLSQLGAIGKAIQQTFGTNPASIATPPFSTTSNIPGIGGASSGASTAGSIASGAVSGAMSVLNPISAVANVVTAVASVLSLFGVGQGGQKDRLNIIANNTSDMDWALHGPGGIWENMWSVRNDMHNLTDAFVHWNRDLLTQTRDAVRNLVDGGAGGGTVVNVTIGNIYGTQNPDTLAQQLAAAIKRRLPQTAAVGV